MLEPHDAPDKESRWGGVCVCVFVTPTTFTAETVQQVLSLPAVSGKEGG